MNTLDTSGNLPIDPTPPPATSGKVTEERRLFAVRETVDRILAAVDVDNDETNEYDVVGSILSRAGLAWRCIHPDCRCVNHLDSSTCDVCDRRRPKARAVPEPESMIGLSFKFDKESRKRQLAKENE